MEMASMSIERADPRSAAAALEEDFAKLVQLFERELVKGKIDPAARPHFAQARQAAERGLALSKQLAGLL